MKKLWVFALLAFACGNPGEVVAPVDDTLDAQAKQVYIVELTDDAPPGLAKKLVGDDLRREYSSAISGFSASLGAGQARGLARNPFVKIIEPDGGATTMAPELWNLSRIDERETRKWPDKSTFVPDGDGSGVTIYVIDTGILATHPEIVGRVTVGWQVTNDPLCSDHGTHVSGTAAGTTVGIARAAQIVDVRVFPCVSAPWEDVIAGIDWVAQNAQLPAVANLSLGGYQNQIVDNAVQGLIDAGVTAAIAAGNDDNNACFYSPARLPSGITMGATNRQDERAWFSNFGDSYYGNCLDLYAPGEDVESATFGGYGTKSGTSMATPHAAGVAALYLGKNPGATPAQVAVFLLDSATPASEVQMVGFENRLYTPDPNPLLYTAPGASACTKSNPRAC